MKARALRRSPGRPACLTLDDIGEQGGHGILTTTGNEGIGGAMAGGIEVEHVTVADVCRQFGSTGLLSTIELFAFAAELKGFNNVDTWPAQQFLDQATNGKGARLKDEFASMSLGELLKLLQQDLRTHPDAAAWREPA